MSRQPVHGASEYRNHGCRCQTCTKASTVYNRPYRLASRRRRGVLPVEERRAQQLANREPCGTHAGYKFHRKHGEEACEECRAGEAAYKRYRRWLTQYD